MYTSRRSFLKKSAFAAAGAAMFSNELFAASRKKNVIFGLQLYSVRDDMRKDPSGTLKKLADMGYKYVEHANYINRKFYGYTATDFKKLLDGYGLIMRSGHTAMGPQHWNNTKNDFTDAWKYTVEDAAVCGQKYVISPWLDKSWYKDMDTLKHSMDIFNKSGELCKKSGMKFGYHNHNFEFSTNIDGKQLYELILQYTDPKLVAQQMDIGNMYGAGGRGLDILKAHPDRFELMHVKDEIKAAKGEMEEPYESTVLGKGIIGTKAVVDLALKSGGTSDFIIEQESYQNITPLESAKEDYAVMKSWGF
ncbi:MAG TPA: sugar phosphate isomerase/epimerase family protein [Chitinophagaceae bacterium]|jgi:sugar phosphate isomerase/epimerase|nr:sugar phosphate isomerase/epimerase family protein [Chitinophagaceae bacterium]